MPKYIVNGKTYNIPDDKIEGFERKYPDANIEYNNEGKTYHIPISKRDGFLKQYPNAVVGTFTGQTEPQPMFSATATPFKQNNSVAPTPSEKPEEEKVFTNTPSATTDEEYIRGFGKGVKQGTQQLGAGLKYAGGEALDLISETSKDNADALAALEQMQAEGRDVVQETKTDAKSVLLPLLGHSGSAIDMVARIFGKKNPIANANAEVATDRTIRKALKETGGDVEAAKALLAERANEQTTADVWREEAAATMNEAKPTKGFGAWVGNMIPQMVGTTAGLGLSAVTKSPLPAQILGFGQMAALTASTAGASMKEARDAGATNGEVWATGLTDAVIELATEAIPFKGYLSPLVKQLKSRTGKAMADAVLDGKSPARKELQDLLTKANKQLGGKLFTAENAAKYIDDVLKEGASEATAEALQTITPMLYAEPENYPTLWEVFSNGVEGLKGGIFMGAVLGGASNAATNKAQRDRRKEQGFVDVAEVKFSNEQNDTGIAEVLSYDPKTNQASVLFEGEIIPIDNASENIINSHRFTFDEFDRGQIDLEQAESYDNGRNLETPQEKNDAYNMYEYQAQNMRRIFGLDEDADVDAFIGDDPYSFAITRRNENLDVGQAVLDYLNAKATKDGLYDQVNDTIDQQIEQSNKIIDSRKNNDDAMIHPATMRLNDRKVYIISGRIKNLEDGTIDTANSDKSIIIMDAETGNREFTTAADIKQADAPIDAEQEKMLAAETITNTIYDQAERDIEGVLPFNVGDPYTILDDQGVQHTVTIVADNGDGTVQMRMDNEQQDTTAKKDDVQAMFEAYNLNRLNTVVTAKKEQETKVAESSITPTSEQAVEQAEPKPRIPLDEQGEPMYEAAPVYDTWTELLELNEGNEEEAIDTANTMRENAQAELDKAMEAPKVKGKTVPEIQAAKAQQKALIKQAQDKLNYWTDVANYRDAQLELMKRAEQRATIAKAQAASQEKGRYSEENAALGAPIDFRDYVMRSIATGGVRFVWKDSETGTRGLGSHTGLKSNEERNARIWLLNNENGLYPEEAAEQLLTSYAEELGYTPNIDTSDALSEILDVVSSYATPSSMFEAAQVRHAEINEQNIEQEAEDAQARVLMPIAESLGLSLDEYLAWEEMMLAETLPAFEADYEQITAIFVEAAQQEEILNQNNDERSTENADVQSGVHSEGRLSDGSQAGVGVLQGEQMDNGIADSRGAEAGQGSDAQVVEPSTNDIPASEVSAGAEIIGENNWGKIYQWVKGKAVEGANFLKSLKNGYLKGVFYRREIGDIDLFWGNDKVGLSHIINKHIIKQDDFAGIEQAINSISDIIENGDIGTQEDGRVVISKDNYKVVIERTLEGNWIVTAYDKTRPQKEKRRSKSDATRLHQDIFDKENGELVSPRSASSESKDTTSEPQKQEFDEKNVAPEQEADISDEDIEALWIKSRDELWRPNDEVADILNDKLYEAHPEEHQPADRKKVVRHLIEAAEKYRDHPIAKEVLKYVKYPKATSMRVSPLTNREEMRRKPLRARAKMWEAKVGVPVHLIETFEEVPTEDARKTILDGKAVAAWVTDGEVYLYMPYLRNRTEVDKTYIHEVVAHVGMKRLLGKEGYRQFCMRVYNEVMTEADRDFYDAYPNVKNHAQAADEYIAHLSETTDMESSIWQKVVRIFRDALRVLGIETALTNKDIQDMLRDSYQNLTNEENVNIIEDALGEANAQFRIAEKDVKNVILEDTEERKLPTNRKEAFEYITEGGVSFFNKDIGANIKVSRKAVKHTSLHNQQDAYAIFAGMEDIIGNAVKIGNIPVAEDEIGHTHSVSVMYVPVNINGIQYSARLIVKELENKGVVLEELSLYNVSMHKEKGSAIQPLNASNEVEGITAKPYPYYKVKELIHNSQEIDKEILGIDGNTRFRVATQVPSAQMEDAKEVSLTELREVGSATNDIVEPIPTSDTEPQWKYELTVYDNGSTILERSRVMPNGVPVYDANFDMRAANPREMLDILNNPSNNMQAVLEQVGSRLEQRATVWDFREKARTEGVNGYKIGDAVKYTYNGKQEVGTIYDFEDYGDHNPILDLGTAPVLYVSAQWDQVEKVNEQPAVEQPKTSTPSGNKLVTDERYEELKRKMRQKLGGQMNMGIDPEILAIGTEMAVYHIEKGARKFADLQSEYDALDKDDTEALNEWREKKTSVVRDYLTHIKNRLGMRSDLIVFNGTDEAQMRDAYNKVVASYEANGNMNPPAYEVFKEKSLNKDIVGTYRKRGDVTTFNAVADDLNNKEQFAETMFHENAHRVSYDLYTTDEFEAIWNDVKKSKDLIAKAVEELYRGRTDVQKGKEYIAKAVGYLSNKYKDSFVQFLKGVMPVSELLKKLHGKSKIANLAVEETLNAIKDEYRVQVSRRGDTRGMGRVGYGGSVQDPRVVLQGDGRTEQGRRADNAERGLRGRILTAATDLAASLGVKLNVVDAIPNAPKGVKGRYSISTDQVYFVLPNATSVEDAVQTVLHEVVAHKGLRDVVGRDHFEEFLGKVFRAADTNTRRKIVALAARKGWDFNVATEEYLASLAEQGFDSRENRTFLQKVRDLFMDMLRAAKIVLGFNINDNDMLYMLWRTYQMQRSNGIMSLAEDVVMQRKLGVGNYRNRSMTEREQIIANAKANGTYLKAPNGEDTNLTPDQWVTARTDAFKKWFGDWEKTARIEKLRKSKDATITGDEIEASDDLKQYKKNAQLYGRTLQGEYTNADTGAVISLQRGRHNGGINEVLQHNYKDVAHLQSVAAIPQIIENGIYIESQANNDIDTNPNVAEYQMFVCGLNIGGEDYTVLAKVAVDNNGNRYYDHNLVSVEKGKLIDIANNEQSAISSGFGTTPDTKSTTNSQRKYKELISLLQTNSSKVVDANGEPKEKALNYFSVSAPIAEAQNNQGLSSATKIVENFENPTIDSTKNEPNDDIRYRVAPSTPSTGEARQLYDDAVRRYTKKNNVKKTENLWHHLREAYQDSMLSVQKLMDAVLAETGNKLRGADDVYRAENQLSSKNKAEIEKWERDFMKPLQLEILDLVKKGASYDDIVEYLLAKHGLERNLEFSRREAEEDGKVWDGFVKRDFSGLTELTGEAEHFTEAAQQIVEEFEGKYNTANLWSKINAATKESLKKSYDSGLMSKETYDKVANMFQYYIPLRGWDNNVAADQYEYMANKGMKIMPALKTAKGRKSRADDPIVTLGSVGESSIIQGNRNLMKQKFLNFAQNNPTSLLTISEQWYEQNADGTWRPSNPEIPEEASADEVDALIKEHEAKMEALGDKATKKRQGLNINLHTTKWEQEEHAVNVKRNGKEYKIFVNGNPIAAQAINGFTNPDAKDGKMKKAAMWVKNFMARAFTSMNPAFIFTNLARDLIWAGTSVAIKENAAYARQYSKNISKAMTTAQLPRLVSKWKKGTLDMSNPIEKYFHEFVTNGGETGFTQLNTVDDYKRNMERFIKEAQGGVTTKAKKGWRWIWDNVEFLNRSAEDTTRFMVYLTSRQMGRPITESIANAKDITVNFNKKGRGGFGATYMNFAYIFFNATIQSLANFGKLIANHPKKTAAALTTFGASGMIAPMTALALQAMLSGDDDEPTYWDLPEWVRRNNIVIYVGGSGYVTIPLPHELRPFYGMGELAFSTLMGKEEPDTALAKAAAGFASLMPFDYTGNAGNAAVNFTPTIAQPIAQLIVNKDYFGTPIYRKTAFNEQDPEWTKAYKSTNQLLVGATEFLNELTGGDEVKNGLIDLNPAVIEHLYEGYLGGMGKTINRFAKTLSMLWDEDARTWRNVPVASSFYQVSDERTSGSQVNREYFAATDEADEVEHLYSGYKKRAKMGSMEYAEKLNELINSDVFKRYQKVNSYKKAITKLNEALKQADATDREQIETLMMELKVDMLEELEQLNNR